MKPGPRVYLDFFRGKLATNQAASYNQRYLHSAGFASYIGRTGSAGGNLTARSYVG
jgi:hypothetical protein